VCTIRSPKDAGKSGYRWGDVRHNGCVFGSSGPTAASGINYKKPLATHWGVQRSKRIPQLGKEVPSRLWDLHTGSERIAIVRQMFVVEVVEQVVNGETAGQLSVREA